MLDPRAKMFIYSDDLSRGLFYNVLTIHVGAQRTRVGHFV